MNGRPGAPDPGQCFLERSRANGKPGDASQTPLMHRALLKKGPGEPTLRRKESQIRSFLLIDSNSSVGMPPAPTTLQSSGRGEGWPRRENVKVIKHHVAPARKGVVERNKVRSNGRRRRDWKPQAPQRGWRTAGLLRKTVRPFLGKSDAELPHDPTIPTIPLETLCHLICMQNGVIPIYA